MGEQGAWARRKWHAARKRKTAKGNGGRGSVGEKKEGQGQVGSAY